MNALASGTFGRVKISVNVSDRDVNGVHLDVGSELDDWHRELKRVDRLGVLTGQIRNEGRFGQPYIRKFRCRPRRKDWEIFEPGPTRSEFHEWITISLR